MAPLALAGLVLGACTSGGSSGSRPPSPTRPKARPDLFAYVTLVGTGSSAGLGDELEPVDLSTTPATSDPAVTVGTFPAALALAPGGGTAYVASYAADELTPVDLATGKPGRPIPVGRGPAGVAVAPGGGTAWVTDAGANPLGHTLVPVDLATGKAGTPIQVGQGPEGIAITPDGATAFVADSGAVVTGQAGAIGHSVTAVDLATGATKTIPVGNAPETVAVSPDGATVYVGNANSGSITPITVSDEAPGTPIPLGGSPQGIAFSPDGRTAWVTVDSSALPSGGGLVPIDVATGRAGPPIPVGKAPAGVAITENGATAWVAVAGGNRLVPVDLATRTAGPPVALDGGPYALALGSRVPPAQGAHRARPKR